MADRDQVPSIVLELARAKDQLTAELEMNLKQLRAVIKESERIARELELVLGEAQSPTAVALSAKTLRRLELEGKAERTQERRIH